jgi:hypothetical protein
MTGFKASLKNILPANKDARDGLKITLDTNRRNDFYKIGCVVGGLLSPGIAAGREVYLQQFLKKTNIKKSDEVGPNVLSI